MNAIKYPEGFYGVVKNQRKKVRKLFLQILWIAKIKLI